MLCLATRVRVLHSHFTQKSLQTATIGRNQSAGQWERQKGGRRECTNQSRGVNVSILIQIAMAKVVFVAVILEDKGVDFGGGHGSYGGRQSASEKRPGNAGIVYAVITFTRSAGRNLVDLSGHSYLSLILLLRISLLRTICPLPPLFLDLPLLYWHMRNIIDFDS